MGSDFTDEDGRTWEVGSMLVTGHWLERVEYPEPGGGGDNDYYVDSSKVVAVFTNLNSDRGLTSVEMHEMPYPCQPSRARQAKKAKGARSAALPPPPHVTVLGLDPLQMDRIQSALDIS